MKFPISVSIALAAFVLAGVSSEAQLAVSRATAANLISAPEIIAADIVEDFQAAPAQFAEIANDLKG